VIDGSKELGTGAGPDDLAGAQKALESYLAKGHRPPTEAPSKGLLVDEILSIYLKKRAPHSRSAAWIAHMATPILAWWSGKTLGEINEGSCGEYTKWRCAQTIKQQKRATEKPKLVSDQTVRHELSILSAAINYYHGSHKALDAIPVVHLPAKAGQHEDYFLTRQQIAARVRAARRNPQTRHVARMLLIGFYSGSRPGSILKLSWMPSTVGGWVDLDRDMLYRKPDRASDDSNKKAPKARLHQRLKVLCRYWRKRDLANGITSVIHYRRKPLSTKLRRSWDSVAKEAGHKGHDGAHILRHSCATWLMQRGVSPFEAAGYLGMSEQTLRERYGHHHPDFQRAAASAVPGSYRLPVNRTGTK
jgi:integrase